MALLVCEKCQKVFRFAGDCSKSTPTCSFCGSPTTKQVMANLVSVEPGDFPKLPNLGPITGWGICRKVGRKKLWAHYLYESREEAQRFADSIETEMQAEVNVSLDRPHKFVEKKPNPADETERKTNRLM
jgi:hypothetical protein